MIRQNETPRIPALLVTLDSVRKDPALQPGGRGDRKIVVTTLYPETEVNAVTLCWSAGSESSKTPVQVMADLEVAVFNHHARQTRHWHNRGTEIYMVLEGEMFIWVQGEEHVLRTGDMIVVSPGAEHEVLSKRTEFLCRVVSVHCSGKVDKHGH
jgi:mannose-6-phosphate isomerase-like protein (cupin superfamily)